LKRGKSSTPIVIYINRSRTMKLNKNDDQAVLAYAKKIIAINKLGGKCKKCGCTDFICLDFHHINDKSFGISRKRYHRFSVLGKEQIKCTLLCANCHTEEHTSNTGRHFISKELIINGLENKKCSICGYDKCLSSLDFHHIRGKKKFGINSALTRSVKITVKEFQDEVKKCDLVCRNCHRKIHHKEKYDRLKEHIEKRVLTHKEIQPAVDRNVVKEMLESGMRPIQVARKIGCAKSTISYVMKQLKISVPYKNPNDKIFKMDANLVLPF